MEPFATMPSFRVLVFTLVLLLLLLLYGDTGEGQWQQEPHSALECPDQDLPFLADFTCVSNDSVNFTEFSIKIQPRNMTNRPSILLSMEQMDQSQLLYRVGSGTVTLFLSSSTGNSIALQLRPFKRANLK